MIKNLPLQEVRVQPLDQEDLLEEEIATHSSILAWKNPMNRRAWQATVHGVTRVRYDLMTKSCYFLRFPNYFDSMIEIIMIRL